MKRTLVATSATLILVAACAAPSPRARPEPVFAPPAALTLSGIAPVPVDLPKRIGPYTEFKGAGLLDWSPDGRALLVTYLRGTRTQLHSARGAGAALTPITQANEPTRAGVYLPSDANIIVFERDAGGSEASRIFRLELSTGTETPLTDAALRCDMGPFNRKGTAMLAGCARLDRNAGGNVERAGGVTGDFVWIDVKAGATRTAARLPGTGWFATDISADQRTALLARYRSSSDTEVWTLDLATGERKKVLPLDGEPAQYVIARAFGPGDRYLFVTTDRFGEFRQLYRYDTTTQRFDGVTAGIPWDVSGVDVSNDRSRLAVITNEGGRGVPRLYDARTLQPIAAPAPAGLNVTRVRLSPDATLLAYSATSASAPSEVRVLDTAADRTGTWAAADTAGIDTSGFQPIDVIQWRSFDGRAISGLIQRPPKKFTGKRPVLIEIHGGPEVQATLSFNGRYNYIVNELGIAFIEPNVRGSSGFGKTFAHLDDGRLREDSVKDIGALLDWIALQPDLDASRVIVQGGSYGGYMANAVAVRYSNRIRGAIPAVSISNFVTFLNRTESYRRDLRRAEYGDERDPAMHQFLTQISPLTHAGSIKVPMFFIQGRNDPRTAVQEAEQMAAAVAANGVPVWTMIAENEGHGFAKKENADYAFYARVMFLQRFLLGESE